MAQKISVVIPNYNGSVLLKKNTPQVVKICKDAEIIIVDDASKDDSVEIIKKNFPQVKLIKQAKNGGFAHSVNTGVKAATADLVLLLNSDVSPRLGFLEPLQKHFKNKNTFAVGLADYSHENGKVVVRGRGGAKFSRGFLAHFKAENKAGESLWVSGGSSLIDKNKFLELGGFDEAFAPFYWEDIDLCYRARKKGYICIYEPASCVDHYHEEGAIKSNFKNFYIKSISYRNQIIFVWKNISDLNFIAAHIAYLPYHIAKAIITADAAFLYGFLLAVFKIPQLILQGEYNDENKLSDTEVLKNFAKP